MTDMDITHSFIPPFPTAIFPSGRVNFYIKDDIFGKIPGKKNFVRLYTWTLYAKFYDNKKFKFNNETMMLEKV